MSAFDIVPEIQYYTRKEVNYERETNRKERSVDKKQPEFRCWDIKTLAQVGANPERITFKKSEYPL